jgi:hypothetical protein
MMPYADAGPLYGMMLPILISLSLAPTSYFLAAHAGNAQDAIAPPSAARLERCMASSVALRHRNGRVRRALNNREISMDFLRRFVVRLRRLERLAEQAQMR